MATHAKSSKVSLTKERRQETWHNLTSEQQAVLKQHIRYQHTSLFVDQNLIGHGSTWQFVAYNYNDNYDANTGPQLYCDCGRRLKHQYVLQNQDGTLIKLGITHFADHIGIPEAVMRQLQTKIHHLDFGLDELLQRIRRHAGLNSEMRQWVIDNHTAYPDLPVDAIDFVAHSLPLEKDVQAEIVRQYKKATYTPKPRQPRRKKPKLNKAAWQELFRDI